MNSIRGGQLDYKASSKTIAGINRVRRQSGFPTFIMAQRHYVRMSATRYRCGDNRTKVKTFVTSAWYH